MSPVYCASGGLSSGAAHFYLQGVGPVAATRGSKTQNPFFQFREELQPSPVALPSGNLRGLHVLLGPRVTLFLLIPAYFLPMFSLGEVNFVVLFGLVLVPDFA